jgi:hypothetical protein
VELVPERGDRLFPVYEGGLMYATGYQLAGRGWNPGYETRLISTNYGILLLLEDGYGEIGRRSTLTGRKGSTCESVAVP